MRTSALITLLIVLCAGLCHADTDSTHADVVAVAEWLLLQERVSTEVIDRLESPSEMYPTSEDDSMSDLMVNIEMSVRAMREECRKARSRTQRMYQDFTAPTSLGALESVARMFGEVEEELADCVALLEEIDGDLFGFIEHEPELARAMMRLQTVGSVLEQAEEQRSEVMRAARRLVQN